MFFFLKFQCYNNTWKQKKGGVIILPFCIWSHCILNIFEYVMEGMFSRLKTKVLNAVNLDIPSIPAHVHQSGSVSGNVVDSSSSSSTASSSILSPSVSTSRHIDNRSLPNKFTYNRPTFLQLLSQDELRASADHNVRPIIVPRDISIMPWNTGYAECVNSGKSEWNEDQAAFYRQILTHPTNKDEPGLPYTYFGIFDGKQISIFFWSLYREWEKKK